MLSPAQEALIRVLLGGGSAAVPVAVATPVPRSPPAKGGAAQDADAEDAAAGDDTARLRRMLKLACSQDVPFAFGLAGPPRHAEVRLDRRKAGRALARELSEAVPGLANLRWGHVEIDLEVDPGLVDFYVNLAVTGMAVPVAKALKGTGYRRVRFLLEGEDSEIEGADADDAESTGADGPLPQAPPDPATQLSAAQRQRILDWSTTGLTADPDGFFTAGTRSSTKAFVALQGRSPLGQLSPAEQGYFVDRTLARWDTYLYPGVWAAGSRDEQSSVTGPGELAAEVGRGTDAALRGLVGQRMALHAGQLAQSAGWGGSQPGADQRRVADYARAAVVSVSGPIDDEASDVRADAHRAELAQLFQGLPPATAGAMARGLLSRTAPWGYDALSDSHALNRVLGALNQAPAGPSTSAFVQNAFVGASVTSYERNPPLAGEMGAALAREWYPDDPAAQAREAQRLSALLATPQGRALLGHSPDGKVPDAARVNALAILRLHPEISAATLATTEDPWANPAIVGPLAQASAQRYLTRGDAPQTLAKSDLDNSIGVAMGLPPALPPGMSAGQAQQAAARGGASMYASGPSAPLVKAVADAVRTLSGGDSAQVTVLPITYSGGETGPVQLPLFRVRDAQGKDRFVDNLGRIYQDFNDFRQHNKLPPGTMSLPKGGHLAAGADGANELESANTPETPDTLGKKALKVVDTAALIGGMLAGAAVIIGTDGLAAPAVATLAAGWGVARDTAALSDRSEHGQSINPLDDDAARGLWVGLGANALGVCAFASAARLGSLARAGQAVAPVEASLHGYVQAGAAVSNLAAMGNESVAIARQWDQMSEEQKTAAILQMGFWGVTSAAGARHAESPGDMFNPLRIRDNLLKRVPPPVVPDARLEGNRIEIRYDPKTGAPLEIRTGPRASQEDVDLHVSTAQAMRRALTLEGRLAAFMADPAAPSPGTQGWGAKVDMAKIRERIRITQGKLARGNLDAAAREQLQADIEADNEYLDQLSRQLDSWERDPAHANVAAPSTALAKAQALGLDKKLGGYAEYCVWKEDANGKLIVTSKYPQVPQWEVKGSGANARLVMTRRGVPLVDGVLPINSKFAGQVMPRSELTPAMQKRYSTALQQLPPKMQADFRNGVRFTQDGFPEMPSLFEAKLDKKILAEDRDVHFEAANQQLLKAGKKALLARGLTQGQADAIFNSIAAEPDASPRGWTWHHSERTGELELVPRGIHEAVKHTGGNKVWGGGST